MSNLQAAILPVTPFQQNCTFIWSEESKNGVVIDPGGDVDRILAAIKECGMEVEKIVLTHGHIDHAGGAKELREHLGVEIEGPHREDEFLLNGLEAQAQEYGLQGVQNVQPDKWLNEGEILTMADLDFEILHCPGHSPGSLVYHNRQAKFALVGDVLFQGSIGRTDFPYGDTDALLGAIETKLLPLGDDVSFICGHGPGSTLGDERKNNPFLTQLRT